MRFFKLIFIALVLFINPAYSFADTVIKDDFSTNSGAWEYFYDAYRDTDDDYLVLTPNETNQRGVVWLNKSVTLPLKISFKYKAGDGSNSGDGFTLMFLKEKDYDAHSGSGLGFDSGLGYGIEFDSYKNNTDISDNHIALIKNSTTNHLKAVNDNRVADNRWHNVEVEINETQVTVMIDNNELLSWKGTLDTTYKGIGFSAATGSNTNLHLIDNVEIYTYPEQEDDNDNDDEHEELLTLLKEGYESGEIDNQGIYNSLKQKLLAGNICAFINQLRAQKGKHVSKSLAEALISKACPNITKEINPQSEYKDRSKIKSKKAKKEKPAHKSSKKLKTKGQGHSKQKK